MRNEIGLAALGALHQRIEMARHVAAIVQAGERIGDRHFQAELHVVAQLVAVSLLAQLGAHARKQLVAIHGTHQIVVHAHVERLDQLAALAFADQNQNRRVAHFRQRAQMRAEPQAVEAADAEAHDDEIEIAAPRADQRFIEGRDVDQLVLLLQCAAEPGDGFRPVFDDQDAARRIGLDHRLGGIGKAHALPGLLAHPKLIGHHLEADEAAHAGKQREIVDRLGQEIVGARIESDDPVARLVQRGDHDDRDMGDLGVGLDAAADFKTVHAGHHHVQQHDIGQFRGNAGQRLLAAARRQDFEIFGRQLRFQQLDVGEDIVDDQNPCGHEGLSCASTEEAAHGFEEARHRNRLGDIGLAAALADDLLVALHGEGGDRDHRNRAQTYRLP